MTAFGEDLEQASSRLGALLPEDERDWTVDAAVFIALAYAAVRKAEQGGLLFKIAKTVVVLPALARAWQELILVRIRQRGTEDVDRPVTVSRIGRPAFVSGTDVRRSFWKSYSR